MNQDASRRDFLKQAGAVTVSFSAPYFVPANVMGRAGAAPPSEKILVGVIGTLQAVEAMKVLAGFGEPLCGRLLLFDAHALEWRTVTLRKNPACPVCSNEAPSREQAPGHYP